MKKHDTVSEPAESQGSLAEGGTQRERNTAREGGTQPGREGHSQGGRDTAREGGTLSGREGHRHKERVLRKHRHDPDSLLFTLDQVNALSSSPAFPPLYPL